MKKLIIITILLSTNLLMSDEPKHTLLRKITKDVASYSYVKKHIEGGTNWELLIKPENELIVLFSSKNIDEKSSNYLHSNLIDTNRNGNIIGILLSIDIGMVYIQCEREKDGSWKELWRKHIVGATGPGQNISAITLYSLDSFEVVKRNGTKTKFELSKDQIKKDGKEFKVDKVLSIKAGKPNQ
jgi:hypothetical protein